MNLLYDSYIFVSSTRPTLRRSWILYSTCALRPILTLATYISIVLLYSAPISKGFGLVSILAGVDRQSLGLLRGASFSGTLEKKVRIEVQSTRDEDGYLSAEYKSGVSR